MDSYIYTFCQVMFAIYTIYVSLYALIRGSDRRIYPTFLLPLTGGGILMMASFTLLKHFGPIADMSGPAFLGLAVANIGCLFLAAVSIAMLAAANRGPR